MRKLTQVLAVTLVVLGLLPTLAFAKNGQQNENRGLGHGIMVKHNTLSLPQLPKIKDSENDNDRDDNQGHRQDVKGTVSTTSITGFSLTDSKGTVWTINTSSTTIFSAFGQTITLANITVGSQANVQGSITGNTVAAVRVVVSPANTHQASGRGTVTAVNGSSFTLQLNSHGIISSATVNTNASTTVTHNGSTTAESAIVVGSKVQVKGLWDQILNVLNAIKVRIF